MLRTIDYYNGIAVKSRDIVREKYKDSRIAYTFKTDLKTLRGFCADTSYYINLLLAQEGVDSIIAHVHNPSIDGMNHIVVYVPGDDVVIDATINQYFTGTGYAFYKSTYPFVKYLKLEGLADVQNFNQDKERSHFPSKRLQQKEQTNKVFQNRNRSNEMESRPLGNRL